MSNTIRQILNNLAPIIYKELVARGYNPLVLPAILSQFLCETGNFTSSLWTKYFNPAGMKCGSSWLGKSVNLTTKEEYEVGKLTTIKDNFRVYDNEIEGVKGYFDFLNYSRYEKVRKSNTPEEYIKALKECGWATSSSYITILNSIMDKNNLKEYNNINYDNEIPTIEDEIKEYPKVIEVEKEVIVEKEVSFETALKKLIKEAVFECLRENNILTVI